LSFAGEHGLPPTRIWRWAARLRVQSSGIIFFGFVSSGSIGTDLWIIEGFRNGCHTAEVFDMSHQEVIENKRPQSAIVNGQEPKMPRVKLSEQEVYEFQSSLQVRPQDINYSGHLGNDNLISLVGAARAKLFHSLGLSELDLGDRQTGIIVTDLIVNYKAEAFMFDDLTIDTHIDEVAQKGFRMFHRVTRNMTLIALVETGLAAYNYATKKTAPLPTSFLKCLAGRPGA
jgi:acyl-CoA thioesterase FadM